MDARPLAVLVTAPLLAVCLAPAPASAAAPVITREEVDFSFVSEDLTELCGVPVQGRLTGQLAQRTFDRAGAKGVQVVTTVNFDVALTSPEGSVTLRDVGADLVRVTPDGTVVLSIIGQTFEYKGVERIDLGTGEVLKEAQRRTDFEALCDELTV